MLNGEKGRAMTAFVPRDRILTESDGPFAQLNGRSLFPWDAAAAERMLTHIWRVSEEEVQHLLMENLRRLTTLIAP